MSRLADDYSYRYEALFFNVCLMLNELKHGKCDKQRVKDKISTMLKDSNETLLMNKYILPEMNRKDNGVFLFSANQLLKLHGAFIEDLETYTYEDVNLYFLIQSHFINKDYHMVINELKVLFERENYYNNRSMFLYYFGKALAFHFSTSQTSLPNLSKENKEIFKKIISVMNTYINITSSMKRKGKTYNYLAKMAEFFEMNQLIEIFMKQAEQLIYSDWYNNNTNLYAKKSK